jgi:hypothetical protein
VLDRLNGQWWYESSGDVWIERDGSMAMSRQRLRHDMGPLCRLPVDHL